MRQLLVLTIVLCMTGISLAETELEACASCDSKLSEWEPEEGKDE